MPGAGSGTPLDHKVETLDKFGDLVRAFDTARSRNPGLSQWALTNGLASFQLRGSNTEALGGDLAYNYGTAGALAGIALNAAQDVLVSGQFGKQAQSLHQASSLQEGLVKLV